MIIYEHEYSYSTVLTLIIKFSLSILFLSSLSSCYMLFSMGFLPIEHQSQTSNCAIQL